MKKNQGQKSLRKVNKGDDNPKYWRDSNGNHKFLCLHCLKSMKAPTRCCEFKMYNLGSRARTPKVSAPKNEWKKFFDRFVSGARCDSKGQLKKIIERKKFYGLSVLAEEMRMKALSEKIENDIIGVFDIKRHEVVEFYDSYQGPFEHVIKDIKKSAIRYGAIKHDKLEVNKEYFVVPLFAAHYSTFYIPTDVNKFDIQKCRTKSIPKKYSTHRTLGLTVLTNNKKEVVDISYSPDSQYGYRQRLYAFESRVTAMAFRQEFLSIAYPLLKSKEIPYLANIVDTVNLDYERVTKKAPQLLI